MELMIKLLKTAIFTSACVLTLSTGIVYASEISIISNEETEGIGQTQEISVYFNSQGQIINALEGNIIIPSIAKVKELRDGDSIVNNWIIKPKAGAEIHFAGIIPGGYNGEGKLFSLILETKESGVGEISISGAQALLNDGKGTPDTLKTKNYTLEIPESISNKVTPEIEDITPPIDFKPKIVKDSKLQDGKIVLIFNTQDKESGIAYYEIKEGEGEFEKAESPYILKNQQDIEKIIIRAVDRKGNTREVEYTGEKDNGFVYKIIFITSLLGIFIIIFLRKF